MKKGLKKFVYGSFCSAKQLRDTINEMVQYYAEENSGEATLRVQAVMRKMTKLMLKWHKQGAKLRDAEWAKERAAIEENNAQKAALRKLAEANGIPVHHIR